jgi:hypothetical protein
MLRDLLKTKKTVILNRWFGLILDTYPPDTSKMLKAEKDRFANPVGQTITKEIEVLYDEVLGEMNSDRISVALESMLRIRSVQDFSPSQAVVFVHGLKKVIRDELAGEMRGGDVFEEWLTLESNIDQLSLRAFDIYMKCREKICEIRIHEMESQRDSALKLISRCGLIPDEH